MALILSVLCILQFREDFACFLRRDADAGSGDKTSCKSNVEG